MMTSLKDKLFPKQQRKPHQRKNKRITHRFAVDCAAGRRSLRELSATISSGGLYIKTADPFPPNTHLSLRVALSNRKHDAIEARGVVLYTQDGQGMGVKFIDIDPAARQRIEDLVEKCWWQEI